VDNDEFGPLDSHEVRLQKSADTIRQTHQTVLLSAREIRDTKKMISDTQEEIANTLNILRSQQSLILGRP
jgi:hypothetical protein